LITFFMFMKFKVITANILCLEHTAAGCDGLDFYPVYV